MDTVLHLGAHRTGTTSFQHYLRCNVEALDAASVAVWGPLRTRKGLFNGLMPGTNPLDGPPRRGRARGRVRIQAERLRGKGTHTLLVTEENVLGSPRHNLRCERLYPAAGERAARLYDALGAGATRAVLVIRSLDEYWASAMAYAVPRGATVPSSDRLDRLVTQPRSWRDVVADLSCALPGLPLLVIPFERIAGRPDVLLEFLTEGRFAAPRTAVDAWRNRSPDLDALRQVLRDRGEPADWLPPGEGRWRPFTPAQRLALRQSYAEDLLWLRAGADGMATLIEEDEPELAGWTSPGGSIARGHDHDRFARRVAQAR